MREPSILAAGATLSRELPNNSMQRDGVFNYPRHSSGMPSVKMRA